MEAVTSIKRKRNGCIMIKAGNHADRVMSMTIAALFALTITAFFVFDYTGLEWKTAILGTLSNLKTMFLAPQLNSVGLPEAIHQVAITLGLATLATVIGAVIAFFLGLLAADNLSNNWVSKTIRTFVAFIRAVPTVLWVLIFAIAAGLGSEAAVIGMLFHSIAYLVKAFSESFEEIDEGVIEALRSTGSSWWHVVIHAVIPSTSTYLLSWTFLRFEINFSVAVAMGAAAGAGGIGYELFMASGFYFDLNEVGFITYAILAIAILLEILSTKLKKQYL